MSAIKLSAQKLKDTSNLKTIAATWQKCTINCGWMIDGKEDDHRTLKITVFIQQMAGRRIGENKISNMVLNDLYVHVSARDNYASKVQTESICKIISTNTTWIDWTSVSNFMVSAADYFFSYCFVMGLPAHAPLDTTPLGFIRGLRADGKWNEKAGLYGSKGDYVVYCDGHITQFDGSKPTKFLHWDDKQYTSDIRQTVPNATLITCGNSGVNANYKNDGEFVILRHTGTGGE